MHEDTVPSIVETMDGRLMHVATHPEPGSGFAVRMSLSDGQFKDFTPDQARQFVDELGDLIEYIDQRKRQS